MEIKFEFSKDEFKDLFFYENKKNDDVIKLKRIAPIFMGVIITCIYIFIVDHGKTSFIIGWIILGLLYAFFFRILLECIITISTIGKWNKFKINKILIGKNISIRINKEHIILYKDEDHQYKVSLKNVEIPHIDKTKIYLKIEGRTLYYIPLNAFSSEAQKNEFIDLINKR